MQQAPDYGSVPSGNDLKTKAELDEQKEEKNATMLETALQGRGHSALRRRETQSTEPVQVYNARRPRGRGSVSERVDEYACVRARSSERLGCREELVSGGWRRR